MDKTSVSLVVGGTETLTATVEPETASDKSVTFTSSDAAIATVTPKQGKITAVSAGTAKIMATTANGLTTECEVTVTTK
ncbi:Ig-like domain-containing protein [Enterococcus sp. LJL90]